MLAGLLAMTPACTGSESADSNESAVASTTTPEEAITKSCSASEQATGDIRSDACADAVFVASIANAGSQPLLDLGSIRQVALGRTLCALGSALGDGPTTQTFGNLIGPNLESWGITEATAQELTVFAETLCPEQIGPLLALGETAGPYRVDLRAVGPGPLHVTYTLPDGTTASETVGKSFQQPVFLPSLTDIQISATSNVAGAVSCSIVYHDVEMSSDDGEKEAQCSVTASELRSQS